MKREFHYQIGNEIITVAVEPEGDRFRIFIGKTEYTVTAQRHGAGGLNFDFGDGRRQAYVAGEGLRRYVAVAGNTWQLETARPGGQRRGPAEAAVEEGRLSAAMPGLVLDVPVTVGDAVNRGETVVALEAMKMELRLTAPFDGHVSHIHCAAGQVVGQGQVLVEIEADREQGSKGAGE